MKPGSIKVSWRAVQGDILLPVTTAVWLGDALAVLVSAIHHPDDQLLAGENPKRLALEVRDQIGELKLAGDTAYAQQAARLEAGELDPDDVPRDLRLTRDGDSVRICPGSEMGSIVLLLDVFAGAVLGESDKLSAARGAIAYAAAALVKDLQALTPEEEE